ncbi:hypothetical protein E2C01_093828 [Portunus trituberculatus]|uniref:Uncharacterized protein n=1 Tax=Portunus trituberculatus TaxID=210409 RepID=A0A5B7JZ69_PORTR|nr:hypothetical protein [Portunus trituberculatus]
MRCLTQMMRQDSGASGAKRKRTVKRCTCLLRDEETTPPATFFPTIQFTPVQAQAYSDRAAVPPGGI